MIQIKLNLASAKDKLSKYELQFSNDYFTY